MIKLFSLIFIWSFSVLAHDHMPPHGKHNAIGGKLTVFKKAQLKDKYSFKFKFSLENGSAYTDKSYSRSIAGLYFLMPHRQKLGIFISSETGVRHDDDWIIKDTKWSWKDTSDRAESIFHLVHSIKFRPSSTPLLYEFQSHYYSYSLNGNQAIEIAPSGHYFFIKNGMPRYSARIKIPVYLALNFGDQALYKYGLYTAGIYHINRTYSLALSYEFLVEKWSRSADSEQIRSTQPYEVDDTNNKVLLELLITL